MMIVITLLALIVSLLSSTPVTAKPLHHFVYFAQDREKLQTSKSLLETKAFEGAQIAYSWRQLEPGKDEYDFSLIREDLAFLNQHGKKLWVQIQDVSFSERWVPVPRYLTRDLQYHGGANRQYEYNGNDEEHATASGWAARRWDPAVQDRFHKLLLPLPKEFDGRIEGINFAESSVTFGSSGRLYPDGFTPEIYRDALVTNLKALKSAFSKSIVVQYANFMPGEWRPSEDRGYLRAVYKAASEIKAGVGGPDLLPYKQGQMGNSYELIKEVGGDVTVGIAVQDGNYAHINPKTAKRVTIPELIDFATQYLKSDYIFWCIEEPYYSNDLVPFMQNAPVQSASVEQVKLITSTGIENFVKDLNDNGTLGYRLENSLSYGGEGLTQSFAAVMRLDAPNKYEYDWMSSPDKKQLEARLNYQAKKGFNYTNAYALTYCAGDTVDDVSTAVDAVLRLQKGDAFLLERKNGESEQTRDYKVFISKVRLGDSAEKTIQKGLDASALEGYRPVKILFARQGLLDFSVSVLTERNLKDNNATKTEYRFLKKSSGLPDDVNKLAAQGFRFMSGRRVGTIGMVLMDKRASDATTYNFIDAKKYAKEFDKTIALGNSYESLMMGDLTCGSRETLNERLLFVSTKEKRDYKITPIAFTKTGSVEPGSLKEFQRLVADGYRIKDFFYSGGLNVIFEK